MGLQQTSLQLAAQTTRALKTKSGGGATRGGAGAGASPRTTSGHCPCTRRSCVLRMPKPNWRASGPRQTRHLAACEADLFNLGPAVPLAELLAQLANNPDLHLLARAFKRCAAASGRKPAPRRSAVERGHPPPAGRKAKTRPSLWGGCAFGSGRGRARGDIDLARAERARTPSRPQPSCVCVRR